jgi:hypothetical protein
MCMCILADFFLHLVSGKRFISTVPLRRIDIYTFKRSQYACIYNIHVIVPAGQNQTKKITGYGVLVVYSTLLALRL